MYIEGASLNAAGHDNLMLWVNIVTILSFIILNSILVYFIIRYRRRSADDITSRKDHSLILEVLWTTIPTLVMVWLYVWGLVEFIKLRTIPENAMEINVTAKQWAWNFTYPADLRKNPKKATVLKSANVLYLKENQPVKLVMKSTDVLHSFFVPAFRVKEDIAPHIYTYTSFTPFLRPEHKKKGKAEYDIYCAEYCGKDHSRMLAKAVVLSPEKFRNEIDRIEEAAGNISAARGKAIYAGNCKSCHTLDGSALVGPSFKALWQKERVFVDGSQTKADENYIRESVLYPNKQIVKGYPAAMPVQDYDDAEIQSLIEYLKSLK